LRVKSVLPLLTKPPLLRSAANLLAMLAAGGCRSKLMLDQGILQQLSHFFRTQIHGQLDLPPTIFSTICHCTFDKPSLIQACEWGLLAECCSYLQLNTTSLPLSNQETMIEICYYISHAVHKYGKLTNRSVIVAPVIKSLIAIMAHGGDLSAFQSLKTVAVFSEDADLTIPLLLQTNGLPVVVGMRTRISNLVYSSEKVNRQVSIILKHAESFIHKHFPAQLPALQHAIGELSALKC